MPLALEETAGCFRLGGVERGADLPAGFDAGLPAGFAAGLRAGFAAGFLAAGFLAAGLRFGLGVSCSVFLSAIRVKFGVKVCCGYLESLGMRRSY